ncbi:hypothetical protein A6F68_02267 [Tsuneonella dongtanensis]|uniref:CDP-Glycerol:Poly(Glycerophosphate) glycerophosphotransferase n=1 Tax=Tsuneonella dongtanensis TaxID=692370 RepID=A0A1B2AF33_9SPHN|nr:hypothetical protein [Tsuneonella dongtanensis]ANY20767.1 hypothetical protein A6F68_02267 [Tsuneonella dongtanensis]
MIAYANDPIRARLTQLIDDVAAQRIEWCELRLPSVVRALATGLDRLFPASRLFRLYTNRKAFASADVIVSPERTCLHVMRFIPTDRMPRFAILPHGAGDRSVSYHPDFARFDRVFVAGTKVVDQLVAHGVAPESITVVGYPKFDTIELSARPDFFGNGRPTFVYNPHFDPYLSSWYDVGPDLLRWFASPDGQRFNLIFAPHVMLFRKELHVSPEYRIARQRPQVPEVADRAANIRIDVASSKLFDMSYMLGADAYIGDVSSQVYEFLTRPRPTFFIDARSRRQRGEDEWLVFRKAGPVVRTVMDLVAVLPNFAEIGKAYRAVQRELFEYTFSVESQPASVRAAAAIRDWVSGLPERQSSP